MSREALSRVPLVYPDSDGRPIADNTVQFDWIVLLKENLDRILDDFVAGDLLWYPVEGDPGLRAAPDVLVALGRPKGDRGSYKQWDEGGIAPQVVFEVLSPGNSAHDMRQKRLFYQEFEVAEYYVVDPDVETVEIDLREGGVLTEHALEGTFASPRLGITFERDAAGRLIVRDPAGNPFLSLDEAVRARDDADRQRTEAERQRTEAERQRTEAERQRTEAERERVEAERQRTEAERERTEAEQKRVEAEQALARLRERMRALGIHRDEV